MDRDRQERRRGDAPEGRRCEARELIASVGVWYHVLELGPGLVTPGWFDLRPDRRPDAVARRRRQALPRCRPLRRLPLLRARAPRRRLRARRRHRRRRRLGLARSTCASRARGDGRWRHDPKTGRGFEIAQQLLGSKVERRELTVYDLSLRGGRLVRRDRLRQPDAAPEEPDRGARGDPLASARGRPLPLRRADRPAAHRAAARRRGRPPARRRERAVVDPQLAGHRAMVAAAGFDIERTTKPYSIPLGESHRNAGQTPSLPRAPAAPAGRAS